MWSGLFLCKNGQPNHNTLSELIEMDWMLCTSLTKLKFIETQLDDLSNFNYSNNCENNDLHIWLRRRNKTLHVKWHIVEHQTPMYNIVSEKQWNSQTNPFIGTTIDPSNEIHRLPDNKLHF